MKFYSTRGNDVAANAAEAIARGLASDGGLFVPEFFPCVKEELNKMLDMDYAERAALIIGKYLEEYDGAELLSACKKAYAQFEDGDAAPVVKVDDELFILELFHGPTLAFKDIALTLLPYLLRKGSDICGVKDEILILVATSGDTGKAALSGFCNAQGIKIMVFYPSDGVSDMQKLQMRSQLGDNVNVVGIKGNFDDCQNAVKSLFSDKNFNAELKSKGVVLSSANSINFGRLVPQIAYYFSAYCDLVNVGEIDMGEEIDFVVPTGNFGNILAGYYAKKMGLPIGKLVCASNSNNVLTEFFESGVYDKNREFFKTVSPSMDILISSNLERLIYEESGRNGSLTAERMNRLKKDGSYKITEEQREVLENNFFAGFCDEEECMQKIKEFYDDFGYVSDTHTAVALTVCEEYKNYSDTAKKCVVLSTASPYKFSQSVYKAITGKNIKDAFVACDKLYEESACPIPEPISSLKNATERFTSVVEKNEAVQSVIDFVGK